MQSNLTTHVDTILDSLRDEAEAVINLTSLVEDASLDLFYQGRLNDLEAAEDRLVAGKNLTQTDLNLIHSALSASESNCRELGFDAEADEYEAAAIAVWSA